MAEAKRRRPDCVIGRYCAEHNFVHGAEAEELRKKLEKLTEELANDALRDYPYDARDARRAIQCVLDGVDARDSLAYLERRRRRPKKARGQ